MTPRDPPIPAPAAASGGDTLADMLMQELRVARVDAALVSLGRGQALRIASSHRPMIHQVLAGEATIETLAGKAQLLHQGDVAVALYGDAHVLGRQPAAAPVALPLDQTATAQPPVRLQCGLPPWSAQLLCLRLELGYVAHAASAIRAGPALWCMRAAPQPGEAAAMRLDCAQIASALAGPGAAAFAQALAELLLVHAVRDMYRLIWHGAAQDVRSEETRQLAASIRATHDHPDRPWTVATLAREVGLSRSSFAASFTRKMRMPPLGYLHRIRMEQAERLLRGGAVSIVEAGRRCGYSVPSSFSRAVRVFHGKTPSQIAEPLRKGPMRRAAPSKTNAIDLD